MRLHTLHLPRERIAAMPANERGLLLLFGHIINEINVLRKLTLFAVNSLSAKDPVRAVEVGQCMTLVRLLGGKTFEGWEKFGKHFHGDAAISVKYAPNLQARCGDTWKKLKKTFGSTNFLTKLRNHYALHYPSIADMEGSFQALSADSPWDWYVPEDKTVGNTYYYASEMVALFGLFRATKEDTLPTMSDRTVNEVIDAAGLVEDVINSAMQLIFEAHFPDMVASEDVVELTNLPPMDAVRLPFFTAKPPALDLGLVSPVEERDE